MKNNKVDGKVRTGSIWGDIFIQQTIGRKDWSLYWVDIGILLIYNDYMPANRIEESCFLPEWVAMA